MLKFKCILSKSCTSQRWRAIWFRLFYRFKKHMRIETIRSTLWPFSPWVFFWKRLELGGLIISAWRYWSWFQMKQILRAMITVKKMDVGSSCKLWLSICFSFLFLWTFQRKNWRKWGRCFQKTWILNIRSTFMTYFKVWTLMQSFQSSLRRAAFTAWLETRRSARGIRSIRGHSWCQLASSPRLNKSCRKQMTRDRRNSCNSIRNLSQFRSLIEVSWKQTLAICYLRTTKCRLGLFWMELASTRSHQK